jgi:drug/metabolite transporter (DMT)-like permease
MTKKQMEANVLLLLTALIWGFAFVAQRMGAETMGPFAFNGIRFALGALSLLPVIYFTERSHNRTLLARSMNPAALQGQGEQFIVKYPLKAGLICGVVLFAGASLQQFGIFFTTAGKTGFITALYIILVPIFGIFLKHKVGVNAWLGVLLATIGLYLLCITEAFTIGLGDLVILIGAGFWATHILLINHYAGRVSALRLAFMQFMVVALLSFIVAFFTETITLEALRLTLIPILYSGFLSIGTAFTLQIIGQKHAPPTLASIILSMEAVFGAIGGWLILGEVLSPRELLGCLVMFIAIIISQLPNRRKPNL